MKKFIIFGDCDEEEIYREDLKVLDFVMAETPEEALKFWMQRLTEKERRLIDSIYAESPEVFVFCDLTGEYMPPRKTSIYFDRAED